jgi:molybdopterin-binding protein
VITRQSVQEMNLKKGDVVTAVIKATDTPIISYATAHTAPWKK